MANYRGHIIGSGTASVIYLAILTLVFTVDILPKDREIFSGYAFPIVIVALVILFGIFPDIDINSHSQNLFYSIFFVGDLWLIWTENFPEAAYLGLIAMLPVISKHRGWTHSRLAMLLVPIPMLVLPALNYPNAIWVGLPYYGAAVLGYGTHLMLDGVLIKR